MKNKLIIIAPCYNEEAIIEYSIQKLNSVIEELISKNLVSAESKICFVDDGSMDKTVDIIKKNCETNEKISLIELTKNYGQQNAILAGLNSVDADMVITIDADLQDDLLIINEMIKKYYEGYEIVYGVRKKRETDSFLKKTTAFLFYKFMNLIGIKIRQNHSEFRLMSRFTINHLKQYKEKTIFLRGIVQDLGLKSIDLYYNGTERIAGETKYSVFKLFGLAWTAITSFSVFPLRVITFVGILTSFSSLIILIYAMISYFKHYSVPGWTSIIITIAFFAGIIIMSLGIIGEYLIEVKDRPLYQIKDTINI